LVILSSWCVVFLPPPFFSLPRDDTTLTFLYLASSFSFLFFISPPFLHCPPFSCSPPLKTCPTGASRPDLCFSSFPPALFLFFLRRWTSFFFLLFLPFPSSFPAQNSKVKKTPHPFFFFFPSTFFSFPLFCSEKRGE